MILRIICLFAVLGYASAPSLAASYPVAGKWTYDNPTAEDAARRCGARYMEFRGPRRFDTGGGVPEYRNVSVSGAGPTWRVVDEFFTVQIRGRVSYTLRLIDRDHIELRLTEAGKRILLRRCGS